MFSIGGDGPFKVYIRNYDSKILFCNTPEDCFLTTIKKNTLEEGLNQFFKKKYEFVERSLLEVQTKYKSEALNDFVYALNEVTINRKNTTSMLSIDTMLNDQHLTTYWSDGLIIATPTGSTVIH